MSERRRAREDLVAALVEDRLAADVDLVVTALMDDRVAGDVQHRVAGRVGQRMAGRIVEHGPGEQVAHGLAARVGELYAGERIEDSLAAEVALGRRRLVVARAGRQRVAPVQDRQAAREHVCRHLVRPESRREVTGRAGAHDRQRVTAAVAARDHVGGADERDELRRIDRVQNRLAGDPAVARLAPGEVDVEVDRGRAEVGQVARRVDLLDDDVVDCVGRVLPIRLAGDRDRRGRAVRREGERERRPARRGRLLRRELDARIDDVAGRRDREARGVGVAVLRVRVDEVAGHLVGDAGQEAGQRLRDRRVGASRAVRVDDEVAARVAAARAPPAVAVVRRGRPAAAGAAVRHEVREVAVRDQVRPELHEDLVERGIDVDLLRAGGRRGHVDDQRDAGGRRRLVARAVEVDRDTERVVAVARVQQHDRLDTRVGERLVAARVEPEQMPARVLLLLARRLDAVLEYAALLDELLQQASVRVDDDRADLERRPGHARVAVVEDRDERGLVVRVARVAVRVRDAHAGAGDRDHDDRRRQELLDDLLRVVVEDARDLRDEVVVAVDREAAEDARQVGGRRLDGDCVGAGAAGDHRRGADAVDRDAVAAAAAVEVDRRGGQQVRRGRGADLADAAAGAARGVVDREVVVAAGEPELHVLDAGHLDAVVRLLLLRELAGRADAEAGAFEADVRVGQQGGPELVLLEDRVPVLILAGLDHPRHRPLHELARVRGAVLVLVDDRVTGGLEQVAALDHQLSLDLRRVEAGRREERERRRVDGHRRRLDRREHGLEVAELVVDEEAADREMDVRDEAVEEVPRVPGEIRREVGRRREADLAQRDERVEALDRRDEAVHVRRSDRVQHVLVAEVERAAVRDPVEEIDVERVAAVIDRVVVVDDLRRELHRVRRRRVRERRRVEDERRRRAADVDRVVAATAVDRDLQVRVRVQHPEAVVAAAAVDLDRLDVLEVHDAARAGDIGRGDDERVVERRAVDDDRVEAGAAVDLHRRVLQVLVAVRAGAAEQSREVRDRVRVVRVLLEDEERLQQERVVTLVSGEIQHPAVVVDLEVVVLRTADHEHRRAVPVRHVRGVGHGHAVRELERPVARVGHERHGADDDAVVAAAHVDQRDHGRVVRQDVVVAAEREDVEPLDAAEAEVDGGADGGLHEPDGVRAGTGGVERQGVRPVRPEDDDDVVARAAARVVDVDLRGAARPDRDHVVLGQRVRGVRAVVEDRVTVPRLHRARDAADEDPAVEVVHDHRVVAGAAGEDRDLEDPLQVLDGRSRLPLLAVAGLREVRVVLAAHLRRHVGLGLEPAERCGVALRAGVVERVAGDERVAEEAEVEVLRLDERVDMAVTGDIRAEELVEAEAARHGVVADAAVDHVVERRADQAVVAVAAVDRQRDEVDGRAARRAGRGAAEGARVDRVVAVEAVDDERVAVARGADRAPDVDLAGPRVARDRVDDLDARGRVAAAEREGVVAAGAVDRDRVGRVVAGAEVDAAEDDARVLEVVDRDLVGAAGEIDVELVDTGRLDAAGDRGAAQLVDLDVGARGLEDVDAVARAGRVDRQHVAAVVAAGDRRESAGRQAVEDDRVVAGAAGDGVARPVRDDHVVAGAAVEEVARTGAAGDRVVAAPAGDVDARIVAVVDDVVAVGAAVDSDRP